MILMIMKVRIEKQICTFCVGIAFYNKNDEFGIFLNTYYYYALMFITELTSDL